MNKWEKKAVMQYAKDNSYGYPEIGQLAGDLADQIHLAIKVGTRVDCTVRAAAALLKWQALQFNGEWDTEALVDTFSFMSRVDLLDFAEPEPARATRKPRAKKPVDAPDYEDSRFSNVSL